MVSDTRRYMTLIEMLKKNVKNCPSDTAIIFEDKKYSYASLFESVTALSCYFVDNSINKGDTVVMLMDKKTPELIISFLGIAAAGGIVVPIDCNHPEGYFNNLLGLIAPRAIILSRTTMAMYQATNLALPKERLVVIDDTDCRECTSLTDILKKNRSTSLPPVSIRDEDTIYFNLTSGTTGMPKCAVTTNENIYWNTVSAVERLSLTKNDIHLCMFPPSTHPHELFARSLFLGGAAVLTNHLAPRSLTEDIEKNGVTCMMAISPIYGNLLKCHRRTDFNFTSFRLAESGGMHVDPVTARSFYERFKFRIVPVWGSTESAGIALAMPLNGLVPQGSCGKVLDHYEAKVVDIDGNELPCQVPVFQYGQQVYGKSDGGRDL